MIRVDAELVRRKLARSRAEAAELIHAGKVMVDGMVVTKPARQMDRAQALEVTADEPANYVSRGAYKLVGALDYLGNCAPAIRGSRALDAGASTGGFTDVLLRRGAEEVVAVDVGYGQLAWRLREDPRVHVLERTNVRHLTSDMLPYQPDLIVGDLSFISLTLVIPALATLAAPNAQFLLMVKPQFEVGKGRVGSGGVVRDVSDHVETVLKVAEAAREAGLAVRTVAPSPLPGPAGNVEYFLHLQSGGQDVGESLFDVVQAAVASGPAGGEQCEASAEHREAPVTQQDSRFDHGEVPAEQLAANKEER